MMFEQYSDLITIDELCEILMVGKNTAYRLLGQGQIKAFQEGRHWKIPRESVELFIKRRAGL